MVCFVDMSGPSGAPVVGAGGDLLTPMSALNLDGTAPKAAVQHTAQMVCTVNCSCIYFSVFTTSVKTEFIYIYLSLHFDISLPESYYNEMDNTVNKLLNKKYCL